MLYNTVLFTGNANPALGQEIATHLGIELGKARVGRFSDGEVDVEIQQNVRARDVFVVQHFKAGVRGGFQSLDAGERWGVTRHMSHDTCHTTHVTLT